MRSCSSRPRAFAVKRAMHSTPRWSPPVPGRTHFEPIDDQEPDIDGQPLDLDESRGRC